jgi:hypothetical protein
VAAAGAAASGSAALAEIAKGKLITAANKLARAIFFNMVFSKR